MKELEKKFVIDKFLWMLRLTNEFGKYVKRDVGVLESFNGDNVYVNYLHFFKHNGDIFNKYVELFRISLLALFERKKYWKKITQWLYLMYINRSCLAALLTRSIFAAC